MKQIRAVIFDRDGVLCRFDLEAAASYFRPLIPLSVDALIERWIAWQQRHGIPRRVQDERRLIARFWEHLGEEFGLRTAYRLRLQRFDYTSVIRPYPEVRQALATARDRGVRRAVLSNFSLPSIDASLEAAGLADLIDVAFAAPVVGALKPDAAAYRFVMDALSVTPAECVLFDDEWRNVEGARAVGMRAYWIDRSRPADAISEGAVRDLSSLATVLDGGN